MVEVAEPEEPELIEEPIRPKDIDLEVKKQAMSELTAEVKEDDMAQEEEG